MFDNHKNDRKYIEVKRDREGKIEFKIKISRWQKVVPQLTTSSL